MLDKIKTLLFKSYNSEEQKGLFVSIFDADKKILLSEGVITTDKPLRELLDNLYTTYVESRLGELSYVSFDIVSEIIEIKNPDELFTKDPKEFGFLLVDTHDQKSGLLLPNTSGVQDGKSALYYVKKKYGLDGQVEAFVFRTERIIIGK